MLSILFVLSASAATPSWVRADPFQADPHVLLQAAALEGKEHPERPRALTLLDEVQFRYDADGLLTRTERTIYQPLTPQAAVDMKNVHVSYSPWRQSPPQIRVRVIEPDGTVHTVEPPLLRDPLAAYLGDDPSTVQSVYADVPHVTAGAVVEKVVVTRYTQPLITGGGTHLTSLARSQPVSYLVREMEVDPDTRLSVQVYKSEARVKRRGWNRASVTLEDPEPFPLEPWAPEGAPYRPSLRFSTGPDWDAIGEAYRQQTQGAFTAEGLDELGAAVTLDDGDDW